METQSNGDEKAQGGQQAALPAGQLPSQQIAPQTIQNQIPANPDQNGGNTHKVEIQEPLAVSIVRDDELREFEKKTIRAATLGIAITFLSVLTASIAAWAVIQQFGEMREQTDLINIAAAQNRRDGEKASQATANQLAALQSQVNAANDQLTQQKRALKLDQRPWLKFEFGGAAPPGEDYRARSFEFKAGQPLQMPVRITNIGKTTATDVRAAIILQIVPNNKMPMIPKHNIIMDLPGEEPTPGTVEDPGEGVYQATLYPNESFTRTLRRMRKDHLPELISEAEASSFVAQKSNIYAVGEVWYRDIFGIRHWTKFCESTDQRPTDKTINSSFLCIHWAGVDAKY